jgi:hypothetical protein
LLKKELSWGEFDNQPLADIMPDQTKLAFIASGLNNLPGGTQGSVVYQLGDDANKTISIVFEVTATPFTRNTVTVDSSSPKLGPVLTGFKGEGNMENCMIRVFGR